MLPEELEKIAEHEIELQKSRKTLNVCMAAGCISCQSNELKSALEKALKSKVIRPDTRSNPSDVWVCAQAARWYSWKKKISFIKMSRRQTRQRL